MQFFFIKNINKIYLNTFIYKNNNKYLNTKINFKFNNLKLNEFKEKNIFKKIIFSNNKSNVISTSNINNISVYRLFNLFFLFNFSMFNSYFKPHHNFNLYYVYSFSNKILLIDPVKFLFR
jgi:hypothetical protein